jgi:hypothetical protein
MRKEVNTMTKLASAVALFLLVLSVAAFASPADPGFDEGAGGGAAGQVEDLIAEHEQEEKEFTLYLGPQEEEEITDDVDDRRVN